MRALPLVVLCGCVTTRAPAPTPTPPPEARSSTTVTVGKIAEPKMVRPLPTLSPMKTVVLPTKATPIVSVRLVFRAGSVDDPAGKEGLTALTTRLMIEGGTASLSSAELNEALFPMAAELDSDTDKEFTAITGRVHRERFDRFLGILSEAVLKPRFDPK